jgi:hypothetical protein
MRSQAHTGWISGESSGVGRMQKIQESNPMHRRSPVSEGNMGGRRDHQYGCSTTGNNQQHKSGQGNPVEGVWVGIEHISECVEPDQLIPAVRMVGELGTGRPFVRVSVADDCTVRQPVGMAKNDPVDQYSCVQDKQKSGNPEPIFV